MLLGNNNQTTAASDRKDGPSGTTLSARLINEGRYIEAWMILEDMRPLSPAALFNTSLCQVHAGEYASAISSLRSAFDAAERITPKPRKPDSPLMKTLAGLQNATGVYRLAVGDRYTERFPDILKENILRLMVDCHAELGQWAKVFEIGTPLRGKGFANVDAAMEKAAKGQDQ